MDTTSKTSKSSICTHPKEYRKKYVKKSKNFKFE